MSPACKVCGRQANFMQPLVLVTVGESGPDWMCVPDLLKTYEEERR